MRVPPLQTTFCKHASLAAVLEPETLTSPIQWLNDSVLLLTFSSSFPNECVFLLGVGVGMGPTPPPPRLSVGGWVVCMQVYVCTYMHAHSCVFAVCSTEVCVCVC